MMFHLLNSGIQFSEIINNKLMSLGWGHPNHYVAILNVASIMALYYFTKHRESTIKRVISLVLIFIYLFAGSSLGFKNGDKSKSINKFFKTFNCSL